MSVAEPASSAAVRVVERLRALLPGRAEWRSMRRAPRRDLLAGLTVAVVALAFGITSGLGAGAGLNTAVIAGAVAAVFGGSNLHVSGPTGAMTVVLVPIVAQFGPSSVLVVGLLAGFILLGLAWTGAGRAARVRLHAGGHRARPGPRPPGRPRPRRLTSALPQQSRPAGSQLRSCTRTA